MISKLKDAKLKVGFKVMITENIDVKNGICNGTIGTIEEMTLNEVTIKLNENKRYQIKRWLIEKDDIRFKNDKNIYSCYGSYMPIKICSAITIHKCQGMTLNKCILNCEGIFENSMFYTALSRVIDPKNMKIINFKDTHIKSNRNAFEYETQNKYIPYYEIMLIANDEDKLNT